ncbi:hotdog fold domain-containing protein [uncultured Salinisphaera sp.]|uniref:hotdog fold domain-containing protein n=1 Tax=uncultured Salinisphaera sp. TaxID=359372 RepID=UPI0032B13935|tara:strand:- start:43 stop:513 length:471 start_codon:yes stop_codon:yes gene_type:complete
MTDLLTLWKRAERLPGGRQIFSRAVAWRAPYFATIRPRFEIVSRDRCVVHMAKRRAVQNHIGTVHAIAMCNLAEAAAGVLAEVSVPSTHRWIPKGMQVRYVAKASTDIRATAVAQSPAPVFHDEMDYPIVVDLEDSAGQTVVSVVISMWVTARPSG